MESGEVAMEVGRFCRAAMICDRLRGNIIPYLRATAL